MNVVDFGIDVDRSSKRSPDVGITTVVDSLTKASVFGLNVVDFGIDVDRSSKRSPDVGITTVVDSLTKASVFGLNVVDFGIDVDRSSNNEPDVGITTVVDSLTSASCFGLTDVDFGIDVDVWIGFVITFVVFCSPTNAPALGRIVDSIAIDGCITIVVGSLTNASCFGLTVVDFGMDVDRSSKRSPDVGITTVVDSLTKASVFGLTVVDFGIDVDRSSNNEPDVGMKVVDELARTSEINAPAFGVNSAAIVTNGLTVDSLDKWPDCGGLTVIESLDWVKIEVDSLDKWSAFGVTVEVAEWSWCLCELTGLVVVGFESMLFVNTSGWLLILIFDGLDVVDKSDVNASYVDSWLTDITGVDVSREISESNASFNNSLSASNAPACGETENGTCFGAMLALGTT